jgi:exodeoxyribonuclease X
VGVEERQGGAGSEAAVVMSGLLFMVVDCETTGPDEHDQPIEIAYCATDLDGELCRNSVLVKPTIPISPGASACHHMIEEDLVNALSLDAAMEDLMAPHLEAWTEASAYVAHNAPFDRRQLPLLNDRPWLDTLRMARRYLPDLTSHANQVLRYALKLPVPRDIPAHRALGDCIVTAALLRYLLTGPARDDFERLGVAEFAKHVDSPMVLGTVNFGKHVGKKWDEVPRDYLAWIVRQPDFDPDVTFTARHYLRLCDGAHD